MSAGRGLRLGHGSHGATVLGSIFVGIDLAGVVGMPTIVTSVMNEKPAGASSRPSSLSHTHLEQEVTKCYLLMQEAVRWRNR